MSQVHTHGNASHASQTSRHLPSTVFAGRKGEIFKQLNQSLIINSYNLPEFIYQADKIPENLLTAEISMPDRRIILEGAELPITFYHGYPAVMETKPLWEQLPYESDEAFGAYMMFLEIPDKTNFDTPIRLLPHVAAVTGKAIEKITEWCHIFYWHFRSRAYDLFLAAAHRKQREQRIMSIEGKHFTMAERALAKINTLVEAKLDKEIAEFAADPAADTETKAKDLISMAKDLVAIQRISVGLPANGIEKLDISERGPKNAKPEEIFRHIAKEGSSEEVQQQRSAEMDNLLANPEDLATIQNLLVKVQRPTYVPPSWDTGKVIDVESEVIVETTTP